MRSFITILLFFASLFCLFGVGVAIFDSGDGASGTQARAAVTINQRVYSGLVWGVFSVVFFAIAMYLTYGKQQR